MPKLCHFQSQPHFHFRVQHSENLCSRAADLENSSSLRPHLLYIFILHSDSEYLISPPLLSSFYFSEDLQLKHVPPYDNNILRLIKYQWSLPEEVLTPDTLFIPILILALKEDYPGHTLYTNTDPCIKGRLTKMYSYICTLHITKYPGIYCTLVNYSLLPSTKYSTPNQE